MKRSLFISLMLIYTVGAISQVHEITLKNPEKIKTISTDTYLRIDVDIAGDSLETGTISYEGEISSLNENELLIYPSYIRTSWQDKESNSFSSEQHFTIFEGDRRGTTPLSIDPKTVSGLHYQSNGSAIAGGAAGVLAALGYTAAIVVAPLISINYRTGDFNVNRYYKVAGTGLIAVGITLPIAVIFSGKSFELKNMFEQDEWDEGWEFDFDQ